MGINRKKHNKREDYVTGNLATQLNVVPERIREEGLEQQPAQKPKVRRSPRSIGDMTSLCILTGAIILTMYVCVEYLQVQWNITQTSKKIAVLESDLVSLQAQNDSIFSNIDSSIDLEYIYNTAINELGMVYPNENQVINYESTKSDYVRQYEEIPESKSNSILNQILENLKQNK